MTYDDLLNDPRFQEGGLGRFVEAFYKQFPDGANFTMEELIFMENYYVNAIAKGLK